VAALFSWRRLTGGLVAAGMRCHLNSCGDQRDAFESGRRALSNVLTERRLA